MVCVAMIGGVGVIRRTIRQYQLAGLIKMSAFVPTLTLGLMVNAFPKITAPMRLKNALPIKNLFEMSV